MWHDSFFLSWEMWLFWFSTYILECMGTMRYLDICWDTVRFANGLVGIIIDFMWSVVLELYKDTTTSSFSVMQCTVRECLLYVYN